MYTDHHTTVKDRAITPIPPSDNQEPAYGDSSLNKDIPEEIARLCQHRV